MLTHHKLNVYEKALALAASAEPFSASWGKQHAIVEHFCRASESIVLNIAEGARLVSAIDKARTLDHAIGSTLECAACLDIAHIKGRLSFERALLEKKTLAEITRMLVGLRKAWLGTAFQEEASLYQAAEGDQKPEMLFYHEPLHMYQVGLEFMRWFVAFPGGKELSDRLFRAVDKFGTSAVLNVAEGNGRYSELDHVRFLEIAAASAVKAATYLDLYQQKQKGLAVCVDTSHGRELLSRIVAMVNKF